VLQSRLFGASLVWEGGPLSTGVQRYPDMHTHIPGRLKGGKHNNKSKNGMEYKKKVGLPGP
jgi:hypothetical protein